MASVEGSFIGMRRRREGPADILVDTLDFVSHHSPDHYKLCPKDQTRTWKADCMTYAARQVLADVRLALDMLQAETDADCWRVHWAGGIALLRAVGHVLLNVDQAADPGLMKVANAAHRRWKSADPAHAVYREFILEERNNILKEYRSKVHPLENVPVAIRLTLVHPETGEVRYLDQQADFGDNLFRPIVEGYGEGEDARDVFEEAIDWWDRELSVMESELIGTRRR